MIGLQQIRDDPEAVKAAVARKGEPAEPVDRVYAADERRRAVEAEVNELRAQRNAGSREIGALMREGRREEGEALKARMAELSARIDQLEAELDSIREAIEADLLLIPNLPHPSVPDGNGAEDNPVVRIWGEPRPEGSAPPHWEIAERLGLFDLERGAKISGSGFIVYTGPGARLQRALIGLMLELALEAGYTEIWSPLLVNAASARGTGQLPDKEAQMYVVERDELYLIPTAEVPVTNLYRDEILPADRLPIYHAAYTPCFRREAGAAGKDTRGLLRVHQFDKVEMVKFVHPATSYDELETLTADAERVLQALELPYRVVERCTRDVGFAQAKGYDLEAWAPGVGKWLEVSSASNYTDFQARRMNLRFRPAPDARPELVHTLNASGLGMSRTYAALLETHLQEDGSLRIPARLQPHLGAAILP
ncbi:MAG TPA: serine--tRNA ligase [candidate division Zixibacteria bacterium]|nr:serine--tRNA ligase [candidate division Zixibacteria bacterium]